MRTHAIVLMLLLTSLLFTGTATSEDPTPPLKLWYDHPAAKWESALPVGNGRLGAMVFGKSDVERIQLNEDTYWSGGPYSQTVSGGSGYLPEIQRLVFEGKYREAHTLFGRHLMGYPVEQQKYQSIGDLILTFGKKTEVTHYRMELDLDSAIVRVRYEQDGVQFQREVFASAVDQVLVVRLTASSPGAITFSADLRGLRNDAHSNYATDYFLMDRMGNDGLQVTGRSADYLGIKGALRYRSCLRAVPTGGTMTFRNNSLVIDQADEVTLYIAAATNFVNFMDVRAEPEKRTSDVLKALRGRSFDEIRRDHVREYQKYFTRVTMDLPVTADSYLPTDQRIKRFDGKNDPDLARLCFQFGRYILISSSRPETQPANLQGIWNASMNPMWDAKYTTNINTEMNYWPAEVCNLTECAEPLFTMINELTVQGGAVAREYYGARGWVFHQNTDLWRVAAPMDGPQWGTFTTGGAWLCTHLWEHFLYTGDTLFLRQNYPIMKGNVEFFLDFLVKHPTYGWLVTNPSTSPENFPDRPDNGDFFDEVTSWNSPGVTICAGSTIDMQILSDLLGYVAEAANILGSDESFRAQVLAARSRLAPMRINKKGELEEWLEGWPQKEKAHRHISHLYGLYPGHQISLERTPGLANAAAAVLEQRGLVAGGWSSAWRMCCWTRLKNADKALENFAYYIRHYTLDDLFAGPPMQVDGTLGVTAGIAEMILQSHDGVLDLLPALPSAWSKGEVKGLCARGGFVIDLSWRDGALTSADVVSNLGSVCRIRADHPLKVVHEGVPVRVREVGKLVFEFDTRKGARYKVT